MNYKTKLAILGLVSNVFAANFAVVSFEGACKLNAGGSVIEMTPDSKCPNLYKATADVSVGSQYNYVCGGKEDVTRTLAEENTHNELFGRALTNYDMPEFGYPNAEPWNRSIGRTELFDPDYVPIVIMDGDESYFVKGSGSTTLNEVTFILKDNVFTFNSVPVEAKNGDEDKFQMKIKLPDGGIYNRDVLKFRPSSYDPAFIRQILYGDIAHAIGTPTHESVATRVYLKNGTGVGLYVLQEEVSSESFIKTAFYGNEDGTIKSYTKSPIYDCATGADFNVNDANWLGGFITDTPDDLKIELLEMTRQVDQVNINDPESIKNLEENWLDLDTLFRALALEYLAGHWDSFWFLTSNFVTYHPAEETEGSQYSYTKYKYYFVDQDFDQTWSIGLKPALIGLEKNPYTEYVNKDVAYWQGTVNADEIDSATGNNKDAGTRVLINKFLGCDGQETCDTKTLFESHLQSIVQHIFNPVAIGRKVDGYKERLDEEIKWDTSLTRLHTGTVSQFHFTYNDFINGLEYGVSSTHGIISWTKDICDTVCKQFGIEYDAVALTPETAAKIDAKPIDPGTTYDAESSLNSGSFMNKANLAFITIATILSVVLYL